jgi:hypothetical protein
MTKHTPGPWHRVKHGDNESEVYDINGKSKDGVMTMLAEVHHDWQEWEEFEANARLIAAAPDMLEALKKARTCMSIPDCVMELIVAAIRKAEGGQ